MSKLTDEDLWPVIDRLALQHPDNTDDLGSAVLRAAGVNKRALRGLETVVTRVAADAEDAPDWSVSELWLIACMRRALSPRAALLVAYIAGMQRAGCTWEEVVRQAPAQFELVTVEASRRHRSGRLQHR